jgi:hypothetical protein
VKPYKLTKSEVLTLINGEDVCHWKVFVVDFDFPCLPDPPHLPLHLQLCVEDSEERLTETQVEELIALSKKYLIPPPDDS